MGSAPGKRLTSRASSSVETGSRSAAASASVAWESGKWTAQAVK